MGPLTIENGVKRSALGELWKGEAKGEVLKAASGARHFAAEGAAYLAD